MFSRRPTFPGELKLIHWQLHFVKSCRCRMLEWVSVVLQYCSLNFAIPLYNADAREPLSIPSESGLSRWDTSKCSSYSSVEEHRYRLNLILTREYMQRKRRKVSNFRCLFVKQSKKCQLRLRAWAGRLKTMCVCVCVFVSYAIHVS